MCVTLNIECMWNIIVKKQTTLFGEVLPLKRKHSIYIYIYIDSTDTYQTFVEVVMDWIYYYYLIRIIVIMYV